MMRLLRVVYKFILSRRYNVQIKGVELLKNESAQLILPNHVSHIDPQIVATWIYEYKWVVPVVSERFMTYPFIGYIMRQWQAVPVADFRRGNRNPEAMKSIYSGVVDALEKKRSVIIYPSGELASGGFEKIKNKQAAHVIVSQIPEGAQVIGLRIRGLWGSVWSKAWKGRQPDFMRTYGVAILYGLANLIFFVPRRKVTFELVDITENAKLQAQNGRKVFNDFLEDFYNEFGEEAPVYKKHFFYLPSSKRKLPRGLEKFERKTSNKSK